MDEYPEEVVVSRLDADVDASEDMMMDHCDAGHVEQTESKLWLFDSVRIETSLVLLPAMDSSWDMSSHDELLGELMTDGSSLDSNDVDEESCPFSVGVEVSNFNRLGFGAPPLPCAHLSTFDGV